MKKITKTKRIGEVLVEEEMITLEQLDTALAAQKENGQSLGHNFIELGFLTEDALYHFLAIQHGLEYVDVSSETVEEDLLKIINEEKAKRLHLFPLNRIGEKIRVVTADPDNPALLNLHYELVVQAAQEFEVVVCKESDLQDLIKRHYKTKQQEESGGPSLDETLAQLGLEDAAAELEIVDGKIGADEDDEVKDTIGDDAPVIRLCNFILQDAIAKGASDIHINCFEKNMILRFRIDGTLIAQPSPPLSFKRAISSRYKIMARLDPMERRNTQDGRVKYKFQGRSVDLRLSILPSIWGENIVMRIIDQGARKLDINDMNFTDKQLGFFKKAYGSPYGMILVTGPTGSGKTTTLYSVLTDINSPEHNIMTAEDPVEYRLPNLIQCQVLPQAGLTFAAVLRSFLRQDPDIIMVGEIRDKETAEIATKAALTGHLVISTLHTNDAPATIMRLVDMGIDPMYVGTAVLLVCAQKLLRRNCSSCKAEYTPTDEELKKLNITREHLGDAKIYQGKGCDACNKTGYKGRVAVHEVLPVNAAIRKAIFDQVDLLKFKDIAIKNGMDTMRVVAIDELKKGVTSIDEVLAETSE